MNMKTEFIEPGNMMYLGFEEIEPKEINDGYYKYRNNGTINYNKDFSRSFPEPRGQVLIEVNTNYKTSEGAVIPYIGIKQDGGTRTVYNGLCPTESFLLDLLNRIR